MKKRLFLPLLMLGLISHAAHAAEKADILASLQTARAKLVELTNTEDQGSQKVLIQEIHAATAEADKAVQAMLADEHTEASVKEDVKNFDAIWSEFKNTRETEIIPNVLAGHHEVAKKIALTVQAERMKKMLGYLQ